MPIEQSRAEYLQALLNQRNQLNANNNNLLNPSVPNDIEQQATMNTNMQQRHNVNDISQPQENKQEVGSDNWFMSIVKKAEGFFDNISHAIYEGVFGAVEGVVDLGANILGAIGESTGWYDSSGFDDFTKMNLAEYGADWLTNVQSNIMGARGLYNLGSNTAKNGTEFLKDLGTGQGYNNENYDTLFGGKANRNVDTEIGQFTLGIANSVGFMLPSLAVGNFAGAGTALGKLAGTVAMGISAAGKGSEEALNEGATSSQALGYGALSGAIEGISEYIIPESKFAGVLGKGVSKSVAKTFIKSFVEEGLEEVFSATLEPLAKYLTYDKSAIEQYKSTDYWFGTNGHFNESVIGQFASGGVLGGLMGAGNTAYMKKAVGTKGIEVLDKLQEMIDTDSDILKTKEGTKLDRLKELSTKQSEEYMLAYKEFMDNSTESQKQKMAEMLSNPKALKNTLEKEANPSEYVKTYLNDYFSKNETTEKRAINNFTREMQNRYGTDYEIKYGEVPNNENAYVDSKNKTIVINDKIVAEKGGSLIAHEYFGHVLGKNLSAATRTMFYNQITQDSWYKQNESALIDKYQTNDDTYNSFKSQAEKNTYYQDEVIAYYLQNVFGDKNTTQQIKHLKKVFSQPNLLERILNVFNKSKTEFNTPNIVKEYAKVINKTVDTLYSLNKNNGLLKALYKEKHNYKLTAEEEQIKSENKNLFELVKEETKAKPQVAYSKNLDNNENKAPTYKSIESTKELLDNLNADFRKRGYNIVYPVGYRNFVSKAFTEINSRVKLENQTNKLFDLIIEAGIEGYNNDTKGYDKLGKIKNFFTAKELDIFKKVLSDLIQTAPDTEARSQATLSLEKQLNRVTEKASEYKNKVGRTRVFTNHKNRIKNRIARFIEVTEDEIARNGLNALLKPFVDIKGISSRGLKEALNKALEWYNEEYLNDNFETLPYNQEIRDKLEELYLSLGESQPMLDRNGNPLLTKKGNQKYRIAELSTEQLNTIIDIFNLVEGDIRKNTRSTIENKAYAKATLNSMENIKSDNAINKIVKSWKKGFAPSYVVLRELFGNSPLADLITTDMQQATNSNTLYKGKYHDELKKKMKELGIKDRQLAKTIKVKGLSMTVEQALYLYISLNTDANFNEIDSNGFQYLINNEKLSEKYGIGEAQLYKDELGTVLEDKYKKLGDYLHEKINTEIKQDYMKWYESRYGKYAGRNELGTVGDRTYWMLNRSYQYGTSAEKVIKTPVAIFKRSITRAGNVNNAILVGNAVSSYTTYINQLGNEIFLKPIYRQAYQILNTKVNGKNVYEKLQQINAKDYKYIEKTLSDTIGGLETKQDLLTNMMSAFSVAKLSMNIGSMMKQFASIYTSNIPLRKSLKASITRLFNPTARSEFRKLVDEIGGLKYREGMAVVQANVGNVKGAVAKIADVGMFGIKKMDFLTVGLGVYSLMQIGQDQYGLKIGTQENIDFVKEHWTEFELSQIGSNPLSKSGISRGDYGTLTRAIFSFMQGANRAAFGAQINKVGLWQRNHKVNESSLKESIKETKTKIQEIVDNNTENGVFDELTLEDDVRENYIEYQAQLKNLESQLKDYQEYKIAGGKMIPLNLVGGLIAQGIFVSLINEVIKHLVGKKDWDEWDIVEISLNTALATGVSWLPFVNTISSMFVGSFERDSDGNIKLGKSYDVQVPAIEVMNEMVDIMNNLKDGNYQTMIRQIGFLIGDMTGIPFNTLYKYMYGITKSFNPEIAYEMNSVLYGSSVQTASQTLNNYVEKGNIDKVQTMINIIMDNYKVKSNESINKEIAKLYSNGYNNVMPKSYMTYYTDNEGNTVNLTVKQIELFKSYYDESLNAVNDLLKISDYKNMTNEEQAKIIKRIYDTYYSYARAKTLNLKVDSKLGNYLLLAKKNVKISHFMPVLQRVSSITDSKTKTRKELVFDYINRLPGFSKGEKLLLLYFSGYSSVSNENTLSAYLRINLGLTNKEIKEFLG